MNLPEAVPAGNLYDKYGTKNPVVRWMMAGFEQNLDGLLESTMARSVLDVGCGEGVLTQRWAERLGEGRVVGIDIEDSRLRDEWEHRRRPNLEFRAVSAEKLPFADGEFDLVAAIEVLEHLAQPGIVLSEMARVTRHHLLVSVPREPLWRVLNMARGAYLSSLGNTPGHLNHWSRRRFIRLVRGYGEVLAVRSPLPWTMLLVRVCAPEPSS